MTAVVGELRRAPTPTMPSLGRYAAVIEHVAAQTSAILPARFGTCMADFDEVTRVLQSRSATLRHRLNVVRDRTQMTIRVVLGSDSGDAPLPSRTQAKARSRVGVEHGSTQGTQYLHRRAAAAAQAREIPGFEPIRTAVAHWVKDERVERRAGVITVHHLIPRSAVSTYRTTVERVAVRAGLRAIVSGPFPPYAFAENW